MTEVTNNYKPNYLEPIKTGLITGGAWGAAEYIFNKKPFQDGDKNLKDSFIRKMETTMVEQNDDVTKEIVETQKTIRNEIDALKTREEILEYLEKKGKNYTHLTEQKIEFLKLRVQECKNDNIKDFVKEICSNKDKEFNTRFKELLDNCYNENRKLEHNSSKISAEKFEAIKKLIKKERLNNSLKAAGSFILIWSVVSCAIEFFKSKRK